VTTQPLTAPQVTTDGNNAPAVAATTIVAPTNILSATPTVTPSLSVSQTSAPAEPGLPATATVSHFITPNAATSNPLESLAPVLARTELGDAVPLHTQIATGQTPDQISIAPDPMPHVYAPAVVNGSGTTSVSQSLPLAPRATEAEDLLKSENSIDAIDLSSIHEAMDAIFADGDSAATRVDDALLNLLADEAGNCN
jgi:hypothetical protein